MAYSQLPGSHIAPVTQPAVYAPRPTAVIAMVCVTLRAVEMSDNNTSAVAASPNALEEIFT